MWPGDGVRIGTSVIPSFVSITFFIDLLMIRGGVLAPLFELLGIIVHYLFCMWILHGLCIAFGTYFFMIL